MPRFFAVAAVLCCLCWIAPAQKTPTAPPPKPAGAGSQAPDYSQEGFVVEELHTSYRFEDDGTGKRELSARIKVQSEAGVQQWGQLIFGYNSANERIEIPYVRVLKADGSTVTAPPDAVQDLSAPIEREAPVYTDYRQKHITVPGLRPGEVLEYDIVTVVHTALAHGQFWMEHRFDKNDIVLDELLEVNVPRERSVKLKTQPASDPKISEENGRRIYRWTSSHLQREDEDNKKKPKKKEPEAPPVQMTTFTGWEEMGRWYAGLEKDRRQPTDEIRKKAAELTAGKSSDIEKIEALYDFVAKNFRYISLSFGVGRYQPHAAADVLHNQYGDCKDKHTLLASLLEASGYHASSVLINSSRKLDPDVPSPSQFDHVISLVPLGKEEIWMDTTTEVAPFRLLSFPLRAKQALVVPAEGTPHLQETPADPPMPNTQLQQVDGSVSELGKLTAHVTYQARGDFELLMRMLFRRLPNAQWRQFVSNMSSLGGLDGEVSDVQVSDPAVTREPFRLQYNIVKANFLDWSRKKSEIALPLSEVAIAGADETDTGPGAEPIKLGPTGQFLYQFKLELPAKYTARVPVPFSMKRDYAEYQASYKIEGSTFTAERKLVTRERELPGDRASDYLAFRRALSADMQQHLSVDSTAAGTPTAPTDLKGDDLNDAADAALQRGQYQIAIDLLQKVLDADPKHKTARINLGRAYMGLHRTDQAIDAFRKQADLNPYDEYAYNSLGWAYTTARRYDEAATAYGKAIEINPLSRYAHAALAGLYSEQHKYDQAVPEFEKAAVLSPDDPLLQVSLGDACLNLGQDDKALAAFDRALEISATPVVWNNIAYQLSLKQTHLDRAQQYAESAVAATVAASRNLTLEQLNERDLGVVRSLAAYWDTLGWVYFASGDLAKAEKYVLAAWNLDEHSEVSDHLGQIYEKLGRKDDAIRAYSMAMTAMRPVPEARTHLAALLGGDSKPDSTSAKYREDSQISRTIKLGKVAKETGSAEFFIMFASSGSGASVDGVKFISGDEKLKIFAGALRNAKYNLQFPDDSPAKVVRRGILACSKTTGDCTFVLLLPQDVTSVD
jgi:tetratricopeptide (TPR) repeat protein